MYPFDASSNMFHLKAHPGIYGLLLKGIFDAKSKTALELATVCLVFKSGL